MPIAQKLLAADGTGIGADLAQVIAAIGEMAATVGPFWGTILLLAILLFYPKYGVVISLARLLKEDRADSRKRENEKLRLEAL